ncbi:MAG TPA: CHAT domain-containing protein [Bryobacteraceae bacterium]|nr:CHAT domain-containing protein [Bryobacteraceae bacterium]
MVDWTQFREAIMAGLPNVDRLAMLRKMSSWLDLNLEGAKAALSEEEKTSAPATLYQSLITLNFALQREAGIPVGPEAGAELQKLYGEYQQGTASEERKRTAAKLSVVWELAGTLLKDDPALSQDPSAAEIEKSKLQLAATEIFKRMERVAGQTAPGTVTSASIQTLEDVRREADALIATAAPDNGALPFVFYMTGSASRLLAGCYAIVGRNENALDAFAAAAEYFKKAGEPQQVEDCEGRARELKQHLSGNLDAAAEQPLAAVSAADPSQDQWERVQALMKLSSIAGSAADTFEARQHAEAAAKQLSGLGYFDPGECSAEGAMFSWIQKASADLKGIPLLRQVSQVGTWYDGILGARFAVLVKTTPTVADGLQKLQVEVQKLNARALHEAKLAEAEVSREFEKYFPPPPGQKGNGTTTSGVDFEALMDRMRAVDTQLAQIRDTCNQRAANGQNMDDLLAAVARLEAEAATLNSPEYEAKTRLEHAYILLKLGRGAELGPVSREARVRLLAGRAASLSSFAQSHQRELYLDSLKREAMACMMTGDFAASLNLCEETIRDFETQRYRVNSQFRQSALLSYVAEFYTWAAFSAFKLKRWDNMLEAIDLIKARSAIRSRLIPDAPERLNSKLQSEFESVNAALQREPGNESLKNRRRQLWDLVSITNTQDDGGSKIPALSVAALQEALAENEALIGYFWLSESVILATATDKERFHAEQIVLQPEQVTRLKEFISFIQELKNAHRMEPRMAKLGPVLLPDFLRDFVRTKKRIIFSPHHSLHLFPFHAVRWDEKGFVGTEFAVRYVPNFSSVLLPWTRRTENRVMAIGIRRFAGGASPDLESIEDDAAAIAQYYKAAGATVETLLGSDASRERIEALRKEGILQKFRCVHFGTHGVSVFETPEQPLESRLLVQDGSLDAMDIANLRLSAELAMLSACHSGQRAIQLRNLGEVPGDDIFGLQAALFRSGVRSIAGTLWVLAMQSGSPISRAFHKHYAEGKPAEVALQLSVKEYLADARFPFNDVYYWAPYFISSIGSTGKESSWRN